MTQISSALAPRRAARTLRDSPDRSRAVAVWLFAVAVMVVAMVVVGGATRLTGSGLSITEWKPLRGALPPLSQADWLAEFRNYQRIPQYQFVNRGMTLDAFKPLFWWEWAHRLLGRTVGLVFFGPLIAFVALRRMPRRLLWPCVAILALGGLQGVIGWWMVSSGVFTAERTAVAPERLAVHLGLALALFAACIWDRAGSLERACPRCGRGERACPRCVREERARPGNETQAGPGHASRRGWRGWPSGRACLAPWWPATRRA